MTGRHAAGPAPVLPFAQWDTEALFQEFFRVQFLTDPVSQAHRIGIGLTLRHRGATPESLTPPHMRSHP